MSGGGHPDMSDLFQNMFNGGGGGNPFERMFGGFGGRQQSQGPGNDVLHCDINLDEVFNGTCKKIEYDITCPCQTCAGVGAIDPNDVIKCIQCGGKGIAVQQMGPMMIQTTCPACFGNCTTIKTNRACSHCKGNKFATYKKSVKIEVPKGIPNKFDFKLAGKGNYNRDSKCYNDLVVVFTYNIPKSIHKIENGNIFIKMDIKLDDILCGFTRTINLYGKDILMGSKGYFNCAKPVVLEDAGLPIYKKDSTGNVIITFNVVFESDDRINKYNDVFLKIFKKTAIEEKKDMIVIG
jgi:molecular chaperone DnaJ